MEHDRDKAATIRIAVWIGAIVLGMIVVLVVGGYAMGAFLDTPALTPPTLSNLAASAAPATATAPVALSTPVAKAKPPRKPVAKSTSAKASSSKPAPKPAATPKASTKSKGVVVIDPGHQLVGDNSTEPIGPGASERKPKVTYGASGVATHKAESLVNLQVSLKLRDELQRRGFKVIMVRTTQKVNISNSERAAIANRAHADLFIRIHCDSIGSSSRHGLSTLVPASNRWTKPIVSKSAAAGRAVHRAAIAASGAADKGIVPRSDMSGFNWSKVPSIIVEMGFMSNPAEDRKLSTPSYQGKLAKGMANGVANYLSR